jgi:integrase
MARVVTPLIDTKIKNAKPKDKNYTLADGNGLQLLIKTSGSKLWEFVYKSPKTLKRRKSSLGNYPKISLLNARDKRIEYQKLIISDIDPIDHFKEIKNKIKEKEQNKINTIEKVSNDFFELDKNNKKLQDDTIKLSKSRLKNHYFEYLPKKGKTLIFDIGYKETIEALQRLEKVNKLETLSRVKLLIIKVFKYAYTENIITDTELFGKLELKTFKIKTEVKNNPTLTKKEDIKKLYKDMLFYKNSLIVRYLLLFSIHTAQRQGSIITAKWINIDFDKKLWIIPYEHMKMKKEHQLPLSDILVKYLKELKEVTGDDEYLFPNSQARSTRNINPYMSNNTVTSALRTMGYTKEQQTAHGLRAMFKTVCKENQEEYNLKNEFVERVLAHKTDGEVEGAYNRANNIEDMRKIVNWWSDYINNLIENV